MTQYIYSGLLVLFTLVLIACGNVSTGGADPATVVTNCYAQRSGENLSAVQMTVQGDSVTGFIAQVIPNGQGAYGFFTGRKEGNIITADYTFNREGSDLQIHEVLFRMDGNSLYQGAGGMILQDGKMLLRDKSDLRWLGPLIFTNCTDLEDAIDHARQVANSLRKSG